MLVQSAVRCIDSTNCGHRPKDSTISLAGGTAYNNRRPEEDIFQQNYSFFVVLFLFEM